jgi:hypothetical protein
MSLNLGKINLSNYGKMAWKPADSLKYDLIKITKTIMKSNPDILNELNYNSPPIKENQIYILKTTPKYGYGGGRKITQEVEVSMNWEEDIGNYEEVWFGNYVAIVKLPKNSQHLQRNYYSKEGTHFGIMLDDKEVRYNRNQFSRYEFPIYFAKGSSSCGTDGHAGSWNWIDSNGNDFGFPTGSVWAALKTHPVFINWPIIHPMEVKE